MAHGFRLGRRFVVTPIDELCKQDAISEAIPTACYFALLCPHGRMQHCLIALATPIFRAEDLPSLAI